MVEAQKGQPGITREMVITARTRANAARVAEAAVVDFMQTFPDEWKQGIVNCLVYKRRRDGKQGVNWAESSQRFEEIAGFVQYWGENPFNTGGKPKVVFEGGCACLIRDFEKPKVVFV